MNTEQYWLPPGNSYYIEKFHRLQNNNKPITDQHATNHYMVMRIITVNQSHSNRWKFNQAQNKQKHVPHHNFYVSLKVRTHQT